jgi:hypothetical protein
MAKYGGEYRLPPVDYANWSRDSEHEQAFKRLLKVSDSLAEHEVVGGMLKFQVMDSYAWYLVTKRSPLTLKHVDYMDGYTIPDAYLRGLRIEDVEYQLDRERAWKRLARDAQVAREVAKAEGK